MDLHDKFCGALLGTHAGDALGMPLEGASAASIKKRYGEVREMLEARLGKGTYTDDTEMMIALAESLLRCGDFDGADLANALLENFSLERGYGTGSKRAMELIRAGTNWEEVGKRIFKDGSYGNGSAMRIAPVGCLYHHDLHKLKKVAYASSSVTHAHPWGKEGAFLQALAVAKAVASDPEDVLDRTKYLQDLKNEFSADSPYLASLEVIEELIQIKPDVEEVVAKLGNDSRAMNSVPTAIYAFLTHNHSFEETVVYAVSIGGDTDTIGAMAGAISGGYRGKSAIPSRWLDVLERGAKGANYIEELATGLYNLHEEIVNQR